MNESDRKLVEEVARRVREEYDSVGHDLPESSEEEVADTMVSLYFGVLKDWDSLEAMAIVEFGREIRREVQRLL